MAEELPRWLNTKMLAEVQWDWGQRQWEKIARRASKIITARNVEARRERRRLWRERQRARRREGGPAGVGEGVK